MRTGPGVERSPDLIDLVGSAGLMPHGYCQLWKPWLVALHAGADALIFASYFVIPVAAPAPAAR